MRKTNIILWSLLFVFILTISCQEENELALETPTKQEEEVPTDETTKGDDVTEEEEQEESKRGIPICDGEIQPVPTFIDTSVAPIDNKCAVFLEENGLLIMEAENTKSDFGNWIYETTISGYRGTGYLRYVGPFSGSSPLTYTFKIQNDGIYRLMLRSSKPNDVAQDANNDCFVKVEGDFVAGAMDACLTNSHRNSTNTNTLKENTKFFGTGGKGVFNNPAGQLDLHSVKPWATYNFKAGQSYTLTITGRSSQFSIDRILIVDLTKYDYSKYQNYVKNAVQNPCAE